MTKHELAEFKTWLEEKPERKEGLTGWDYIPVVWEKIITGQTNHSLLKQPSWNNQQKLSIVQQWMTEVDQAERERAGGKYEV